MAISFRDRGREAHACASSVTPTSIAAIHARSFAAHRIVGFDMTTAKHLLASAIL